MNTSFKNLEKFNVDFFGSLEPGNGYRELETTYAKKVADAIADKKLSGESTEI